MLKVLTYPIGPLETNCYLIHSDKEAIAIDPGGNVTDILDYITKNNLTLIKILCTHLHFDHTYGIAELSLKTGAKTFAGANEIQTKESSYGRGGAWGLPPVPIYTCETIEPGSYPLLGDNCIVLDTPGHSAGGLSFYFPLAKALFSGDSLFFHAIGRTDLPGGNLSTLVNSIRTQLFTLPDETIVYPGHGPTSTIKEEKSTNPYL